MAFQSPRRCWFIKRLRTQRRDDLAQIHLEPPVIYQNHDQRDFIIASRREGSSVFAISKWPAYVHVALLPERVADDGFVDMNCLTVIAWAELYPDEESAGRLDVRPKSQ